MTHSKNAEVTRQNGLAAREATYGRMVRADAKIAEIVSQPHGIKAKMLYDQQQAIEAENKAMVEHMTKEMVGNGGDTMANMRFLNVYQAVEGGFKPKILADSITHSLDPGLSQHFKWGGTRASIDWDKVSGKLGMTKTPKSTGTKGTITKVDSDKLVAWALGPKKLEKPQGSLFHKLKPTEPDELKDYKVFLVEHDWAAAFSHDATEMAKGEIRAPFERCAFEFQVSGMRWILLMEDSIPLGFFMKGGAEMWARVHRWEYNGEGLEINPATGKPTDLSLPLEGELVWHMRDFCLWLESQARAICISLDAEIVRHELVRAPHKLNQARERVGKLPINDHHVLSLAKRNRAEPAAEPAGVERRHPRCHFRRGHWRHYPNTKIWINWMLVGDPDLGFIDKHYKV